MYESVTNWETLSWQRVKSMVSSSLLSDIYSRKITQKAKSIISNPTSKYFHTLLLRYFDGVIIRSFARLHSNESTNTKRQPLYVQTGSSGKHISGSMLFRMTMSVNSVYSSFCTLPAYCVRFLHGQTGSLPGSWYPARSSGWSGPTAGSQRPR